MKKIIYTWLLSAMFLTTIHAQYGTERTGYEGDYFSLEGAIELFKESRSIQNFENLLNNEDSWVNNLDLNYDGQIDYIRVEHRNQGAFHAIVLQAALGRRDVQDVAVIEIEQTGRRTAILQIIGDPDLYGEEVIAEPYNNAGYSSRGDYDFSRGFVNVYYWRAVQHILDRSYVTYISPYRWNYYPTYWSPWRQHGWSIYHPRRVRYFNNYHIVYVHRVISVHNFYRPNRIFSNNVAFRTRQHRSKFGSSVAHRTHGQKQTTFRAQRNVGNSRVVAPRNSVSQRNATTGRSSQVSTRNASVQRTNASRNSNTRSTAPSSRSNANSSVQNRNTNVSRSSTRNTNTARTSSATNRATNTRVQSQQRSRSNINTGSRTNSSTSVSPARTQQRTTSTRTQSTRTNSTSTRQGSTAKKTSTARKSSTTATRRERG